MKDGVKNPQKNTFYMKGTFRLFTLVLMAMSVFSCSKESVKEFEEEINRGAVTITAGINNDAKTNTTLGDTSGESTKVYWEEGDSFVLSIGGEDYTFDIDPAYSNENPSTYATFTCVDAPETIAAGDYVAKYSNATTPTQQAGTKEGLSDYQYMEADIKVDTERNLEDVSIKFYTKVSVVELTLTHDDFKGATVSDVALKNAGDVVAQSLQSTSFTGDSDGNIVVYFAVPAGKEFTATTITATCDDKAYSATINSALTTVEGKLYQVKKSMTGRTVVSSGTCGDDLEWEITYTNDENSLTLSITGTGDMYDYSSNSAPWRDYRSKITSVKLPNGLTSIGKNAFYKCEKLASVTFESGSQLKTIVLGAFEECESLTSIQIPASVTEIGNSAFAACSQLSTVTFEAGTQLKTIGSSAFECCSTLTSIIIPASVTEIGVSAFGYCSTLTSINIPDGVTSIGDYAFQACSALTSIEIPAGVTDIGISAFDACRKLASVTFEAGSQLKTIGYYAFQNCSTLTSIQIPASVTVIGSYAFRETDISSIEIPASVTEIGGYAFKDCRSLVTVHCRPVTPPELGDDVFYSSTIYVPSSSVEKYKKAKNWSAYKDHIIGE